MKIPYRRKAIKASHSKYSISGITLGVIAALATAFFAFCRNTATGKLKNRKSSLNNDRFTLTHVRNRLAAITVDYNLHIAKVNSGNDLEEVHIAFINSAKAAAEGLRLYKRARALLDAQCLTEMDQAAAMAKAAYITNDDEDIMEVAAFLKLFGEKVNVLTEVRI